MQLHLIKSKLVLPLQPVSQSRDQGGVNQYLLPDHRSDLRHVGRLSWASQFPWLWIGRNVFQMFVIQPLKPLTRELLDLRQQILKR